MDKIKYNQNMQSLRLYLIYRMSFVTLFFGGFQEQKDVAVLYHLFIQSCRHGWMTFYYCYQRCKKKVRQYHSYKKVMFLFCTSCLLNKTPRGEKILISVQKDSRHIWNCQLLDFSRLLFQYCKHQPPCNVEIKTIRSFGWIS